VFTKTLHRYSMFSNFTRSKWDSWRTAKKSSVRAIKMASHIHSQREDMPFKWVCSSSADDGHVVP
jgi:hypothetical protein